MRWCLASIVVVSVLVPANGAEAQEWRPERPYRGLFAGGVGETEQLLTATASTGAGWDDNLVADLTGQDFLFSDMNRTFRGGVSTASAALAYSLNRARVGVGASAGTTGSFYPSLSHRVIRRDYGSIGTSANLGAGFAAQAAAAYQPYSMRSMLPRLFEPGLGNSAIADEVFPASLEHYFAYSAGAGFTRRLTRRQTFSAMYNYRASESSTGAERFETHGAGARITHAVGRGLGLRLGYEYSEARYGEGGRRFVNHHIDAGVDFNRVLSFSFPFSRRTTLSFGTGTSATRSLDEPLRFRATGNARLAHEIGRTWNAALSYNRGLQFVEVWPDPVFSDSAVAGVGGLINRRASLQFTASAWRGSGLSRAEGGGIESYAAGAGLTVAVTRYINTGLTYAYYHHQLGNRVSLPPGFAHDLDRQSVRASVSLWAPLFQRARTP